MPPRVAVMIAGVLLIAAVSVGIFATTNAPTSDTPPATTARAAEAPVVVPAAPARAARPRSGRVYPLDDAMKRLDLIKPARQKLAEDFTLPTAAAGTFKLSEHRGKVVMINFWATWCPPCLQEMPAMERLYQQHKAAGFEMVAVSVDTDPAKVKPFIDEHKFTFRVALDRTMGLADKYGVRALPSSFIVDRSGTLAALAIGPRHWDNDASHSLVEAMAR